MSRQHWLLQLPLVYLLCALRGSALQAKDLHEVGEPRTREPQVVTV